MKTTLFSIRKTGLLCMLLLLLAACIKEDRDECGRTSVWVKFAPTMYELPSAEHTISTVQVYMFGEQQQLVKHWQGGSYDYRNGQLYEVPLDLPPGTYHFVAWTNTGQEYKTNDAQQLSDLQLYLLEKEENLFTEDIPDLHYAAMEKIVVNPLQNHQYTLYLIPNTYRINLTVKELPEVSDTDHYLFAITDSNTHYGFHNRPVEAQKLYTNQRTSQREAGLIKASLRTLTLHNDHAIENIDKPDTGDRSPILTFSNATQGKELFTEDIVKIIRTAYSKAGRQVDFDRTYEFNIILSFDAEMNVTVSVNGWTYTPNETEL